MADSPAMGDAGGTRSIEVGVLGPFRVSVGGGPAELPPGRLRVLLAILAMSAGRPVGAERLVDGVWGDDLPADPRRTLHTYIARLRKLLGSASVVRRQAGYVLYTPADNVDALRFLRLAERAVREPQVERELLVEALDLWRGEPFEGLGSAWLDESEAGRLNEGRLSSLERRIDLDLAAGHAAELVAELDDLTAAHPLREPLWSRFLTALGQAGRQAEALERYETIRKRIADDLGVDLSPDLQRIYSRLLEGKAPAAAADGGGEAAVGASVPRQLPADIGTFSGRARVLTTLDDLLTPLMNAEGDRPGIVVVHGVGGVGKTTLAVHWAHRAASSFPDGQAYLNLRGYGPTEPISVASALDTLLRGLGVAADQVPTEIDARANLLRSILADRRMLLLLDNARSADQVRPLLPGVGDSRVIVTSRNQLRGLVAREGAQRIAVRLFEPSESVDLLATILERRNVPSDPDSLAELASLCGHLPLALAIAAERASMGVETGLAEIVDEIHEHRDRLDALDLGDDTANLRAVFAWSYRALDVDTARLFRHLGLHPAHDTGLPAAAALTGTSSGMVRRLLDRLVDVNLLQQRRGGRYEFHDLLRAYAAELAEQVDPPSERRAALDRLFGWFVGSVGNAGHVLQPVRPLVEVKESDRVVEPLIFESYQQAIDWLEAERHAVIAAIHDAAARGRQRATYLMVFHAAFYLAQSRALTELADLLQLARTAASDADDQTAMGQASKILGLTHTQLLHDELACGDFEAAYAEFARARSERGQGQALASLGVAHETFGRPAVAVSHYQRALTIQRRLGDPQDESVTLNNLAMACIDLGRYDEAAEAGRQALDIALRHGPPSDEADMLDTLGRCYVAQDRNDEAVDAFEGSVRAARAINDRWREGTALVGLGRALRSNGRNGPARSAWRQALTLFDEIGAPDGPGFSRSELVDLLARADPESQPAVD